MSAQSVTGGFDRQKYFPTRHRGFSFRYLADGSKTFWGYIPGRGRVRLEARAEREALAEWNELRGRVGKGETIPKRNIKLRDRAEVWFKRKEIKLRSSTAKEYRAALDLVHLPLLGHRPLTRIDADTISALQLGLSDRGLHYIDRKRPVRPLSRSQVENYMKPLRGILSQALRRREITVNPFDLLTADDRPKANDPEQAHEWSEEEIETVLRVAEERDRRPHTRQRYAPLIRFGFETGGRLGEILGTQWRDLDLDGAAPVWHVRRQWTKHGELTEPKTKKGVRRVPLTPEFARYLKKLKLASPFSQEGDPVFASKTGGYLGHRNIQRRAWEPVAEEVGLDLTFHQIRHGFASRVAHRGVPLNVLSEILGHSDLGVTLKVYVHLYGREQAENAFRTAMGGEA